MTRRAERLRAAGLDAPMSAAELKRIAAERQQARFGKIVNPELAERSGTDAEHNKKRIIANAVIRRSDIDIDELTIRVPMPPTLTNSGRGRSRQWWALHAEKKRYWRQLDERQTAGLIPIPGKRPIGRATVRSTMTVAARNDDDNAVSRHKWVIDWLATRGYLVNDRLLRWSTFPEQIVRQTDEPMIELTITRVRDA